MVYDFFFALVYFQERSKINFNKIYKEKTGGMTVGFKMWNK